MEDMARLAVVEQSVKDLDKFNNLLFGLLRHISRILENPHDFDLRKIQIDSLKDALEYDTFSDYLKYVGFRAEDSGFIYPKDLPLNNLRMAQVAIERKISFVSPLNTKMTLRPTRSTPKRVTLQPTHILTTNNMLLHKIEEMFNHVLTYEDPDLQELAREQIPIVTLQLLALDRVREQQKKIKTGELQARDLPFDVALLMELLSWFKYKFFSWVDQPPCELCGGPTQFTKTVNVTLETETCRMEVYKCTKCHGGSQFPRHNAVRTLLRTRRGRCGEWANCFALLCRALGYDTRYVYDTTDHVWCEVFDYDSNTWLHADPCEATLNAPLLYSHGWGKKLCYVIALSRDDLQDVTWRYTMDHKQTLKRRTECTEQELVSCILTLREHRQRHLTDARRKYLAKRTVEELVQMMVERKPTDYESHGRISGSKQWRLNRGETSSTHTFTFSQLGPCAVRYSTATDSYRSTQRTDELRGWERGVYRVKHVFRKVENDWKKVYLAREEGEAEGSVSWRIAADSGLRLQNISVRFPSTLYHSGLVSWTVQYDAETPEPVVFGDDPVSLPRACHSLTISAVLSGGMGTTAWQHAQLCRQSLDDTTTAFEITATVVQ